jgi:hypothetical protein
MAHPPARQGKPDADKHMHQEEKDQKEIQIGVQIYGILQRKQYPVPPGIS